VLGIFKVLLKCCEAGGKDKAKAMAGGSGGEGLFMRPNQVSQSLGPKASTTPGFDKKKKHNCLLLKYYYSNIY
jgi:hypothetical protein